MKVLFSLPIIYLLAEDPTLIQMASISSYLKMLQIFFCLSNKIETTTRVCTCVHVPVCIVLCSFGSRTPGSWSLQRNFATEAPPPGVEQAGLFNKSFIVLLFLVVFMNHVYFIQVRYLQLYVLGLSVLVGW